MWYLCNCYLQPGVGGFFDRFFRQKTRFFPSDLHITATGTSCSFYILSGRQWESWLVEKTYPMKSNKPSQVTLIHVALETIDVKAALQF